MTTLHAIPAEPYTFDTDALKLLKSIYWGPSGWRARPRPDDATVARLTAAGLWIEPVIRDSTHDEAVAAARQAVAGIDVAEVRAAFVTSLRHRRLDLRSALSSYVYVRHLPEHTFQPPAGWTGPCAVCGTSDTFQLENPILLNFERFGVGGVRHDDLEYCALDLGQFARAPLPVPEQADFDLLDEILETIRLLPPGTRASKVPAKLTMLPGNRDERIAFLEILGICGVLQSARCPGFGTQFVPWEKRPQPDRNDLAYPLWCWRSDDGVDEPNVNRFLTFTASD
ncbi:hypothetical protein [Dactylosporangium sp. CA-233914]|uniref:hypothetical protein n=1 Tax=Dactylosporangium sp. CA-233914 TaxID=3239934 RepID=UPI003D9277D2